MQPSKKDYEELAVRTARFLDQKTGKLIPLQHFHSREDNFDLLNAVVFILNGMIAGFKSGVGKLDERDKKRSEELLKQLATIKEVLPTIEGVAGEVDKIVADNADLAQQLLKMNERVLKLELAGTKKKYNKPPSNNA